MERVKHQVHFLIDKPEIVIAELTTRTRYYPWWGYPLGWFSNGYEETTKKIHRDWHSSLWIDEDNQVMDLNLQAWIDMKLAEDRLERLKELLKG